jgi:Flp pilus assembly protein TadB
MGVQLMIATAKASHTSVQWSTLAWILGAAVAAAVIITVIVLLSRRPKSIEDGIEEFSRSLQAVAPNHRSGNRPTPASGRSSPGNGQEERSVRATRGEAEPV